MAQSKILVILTGGTIDSVWDGKLDTAVVAKTSVIPDYFSSLILYADVSFVEICMKDSRQLNTDDVERIRQACETSDVERIIITHGTYTMQDTARYLEAHMTRKDQTIILTGSMVPLRGFDPSDAPFNLGYAIACAEHVPAGVYLCMNGRTFRANEVAKNLSEGKFYSVFDKRQ